MEKNLLIATIGGSEGPVIASIIHYKPKKIVFIVSNDSQSKVETVIAGVNKTGNDYRLESHEYFLLKIEDHQNLEKCLENMRNGLEVEVRKWSELGDDYQVVVDFTGGTKTMSAGLVLVAQNWNCLFSYVGGNERTKNSVGIVVEGKEQIINNFNPWIVLGYSDVEKFLTLFNDKFFHAASDLISKTIVSVFSKSRKNQLQSLNLLSNAMADWDSFNHPSALNNLKNFNDRQNDFIALFGKDTYLSLKKTCLDPIQNWLLGFQENKVNIEIICDLYMNGCRRHEQGRYDDSVARFYRCTEALAQYVLFSRHEIEDTAKVPINVLRMIPGIQVPTTSEDFCKIGLQDAFKLLNSKNEPIGQKFMDLRMHQRESILNTRNSSILAHGFNIVRKSSSETFRAQLLQLLSSEGIDPEKVVPCFPQLPYL